MTIIDTTRAIAAINRSHVRAWGLRDAAFGDVVREACGKAPSARPDSIFDFARFRFLAKAIGMRLKSSARSGSQLIQPRSWNLILSCSTFASAAVLDLPSSVF